MEDLFKNNRRVFDAFGRKVTPYEWNKEVAPAITAIATVGHTPGHTSYVVSLGFERLHPVGRHQQSRPVRPPSRLASSFDQDPAKAEETRRKVYDMVVAEKLQVQGFHYPFPGLAHVEKDGAGYRVVPPVDPGGVSARASHDA